MFRFPWGDMHSLNLGWFLQKFNELRADWATAEENISGALDAEIQRAEDALSDVFDARDAAAASATAAAGSASSAGTSAAAAQNSATAAGNSATLANNKATAAGLSEAAAAQSATQAGNSATAAATSATQAGNSASAAGNSATTAGQQATAAAGSATAAAGSASAAATSETNAAASAARAEEVEESIPEDYTQLSNDVEELQNEIGFPKTATYNFDVIRASMNASDTRTLIPANAGDVLSILITQDGANLNGIAFYVFNEEDVSTLIGVYSFNVLNTYTLPEKIIAFGLYFVNATYPSTLTVEITVTPSSGLAKSFPALIAKTLPAFIADQALIVNDFRIVNNILYRITAPIASGGTLTPNTNCIATTVSEVLKSLLN